MNKIIYLLAVSCLAGLGILGATRCGYLEAHGAEKLIKQYVAIIFAVALAVSVVAFYFFAGIFKKQYSTYGRVTRFFTPVLFYIISFITTVGIFLFVNFSTGHRELVPINGVVEKKWIEKRKKGKSVCFIAIRDTVSGRHYEFEVKRYIYDKTGEKGASVAKDFYNGSLGLIYRKGY